MRKSTPRHQRIEEESAARAHRWRFTSAEPETASNIDGRPITILEGPVWAGAADSDVAVAEDAARWIGKTVLYKSSFPQVDTYLRGVVESVVEMGGRRFAVVRHHQYMTEVRRFVPVVVLIEWLDPPLIADNAAMLAEGYVKEGNRWPT